MKILIEINTDNAAFEGENRGPEVARILHSLAYSLDGREGTVPELRTTLRDINGNQVGRAWSE